MSLSLHYNNSDNLCPFSVLWNDTVIDSERPLFYVCIVATVTHSTFWLLFVFYSSVRQKTMQWLYAYLVTDILLLFRFFFIFIVHTTSYGCISNRAWYVFVCYFEAFVDSYLNILEVYILLALNLCRYAQITRNRNIYVTNIKLLTSTHLAIYLIPLISFTIQLFVGWAELNEYVGASCDIAYKNMYVQIVNTIIGFVLPISLNILIIYASIHHVHLTSHLRQAQHHVSAREKYHRSLVIQFLVFYIIWLLLWSPDVIADQFTSGISNITLIISLLNYIKIALDPIIIGALDVRFYQAWKKVWVYIKNGILRKFQPEQRRVGPAAIAIPLQSMQPKRPAYL